MDKNKNNFYYEYFLALKNKQEHYAKKLTKVVDPIIQQLVKNNFKLIKTYSDAYIIFFFIVLWNFYSKIAENIIGAQKNDYKG